jgi:uncharacterized damage-inducible protein DinB
MDMPLPDSSLATVRMLTRYRAWADGITFSTVMALPEGEAERQRPTRFGNIIHTLNHSFVIDDIFRHHLEGRPHGYTARNTEESPRLGDLWAAVKQMNQWYVAYADGLSAQSLHEMVRFQFVGGGEGAMTRQEILLHVVNHATYHRGFVGDMLYQANVTPPANDLPVYLRDVHRA